jgi:hypothetical protein
MSKWLKNNDVFIESDTSQKYQNGWKILMYSSQKCQNGWKILTYLLNLIILKNVKMIAKYWRIIECGFIINTYLNIHW